MKAEANHPPSRRSGPAGTPVGPGRADHTASAFHPVGWGWRGEKLPLTRSHYPLAFLAFVARGGCGWLGSSRPARPAPPPADMALMAGLSPLGAAPAGAGSDPSHPGVRQRNSDDRPSLSTPTFHRARMGDRWLDRNGAIVFGANGPPAWTHHSAQRNRPWSKPSGVSPRSSLRPPRVGRATGESTGPPPGAGPPDTTPDRGPTARRRP